MKYFKISIHSLLNSIVILAGILFVAFYIFEEHPPEVVYVDNVVVFSGFNLSKDLNALHQEELQKQKSKVDSLVSLLQAAPGEAPDESLQRLFITENNTLKEMGDYFSNKVSQQVWSRINTYIEEFGKANNYAIILGTQGGGNIMYAEKKLDITAAFLEYANRKYEGE